MCGCCLPTRSNLPTFRPNFLHQSQQRLNFRQPKNCQRHHSRTHNKTPRTSCIYFKPKIHKANNPGRPIVSACSCPTELIWSYLDKVMTPIVKSLPSNLKDLHTMQENLHRGNREETGGPFPRTPMTRRTKQHRCVQTSRAPF